MGEELVIPNNTFWASAGGLAPKTVVKKVKTAAGIRLGGFVELDTTADEIKKAVEDSQVSIGLVLQNLTNRAWSGIVDPAVGDQLDLLILGTGEVGVTFAETDLSLAFGKKVSVNANGFAKLQTVGTVAAANAAVGRVIVGADGSVAAAKLAVIL